MISSKELRCIDASKKAKISSFQRRLDDFCKNGEAFDNPLKGIGDALTLKLNLVKKIKQMFFIPFAIIILSLFTPIMYISHLFKLHDTKSSLKKELADEIIRNENLKSPINKTLESLWELYGLDGQKYCHTERMDLLSKWIRILYGKKTLERLNINQMAHQIGLKNSNLNRKWFEGDKSAPHFCVRPIVDSLIRKLSDDLPKYDPPTKRVGHKTSQVTLDFELFEIPDFIKLQSPDPEGQDLG